MREYKITETDLGYQVYRTNTEINNAPVEWLQKDSYTYNREHARIFYTKDDAISNLIIARHRGDTINTTSLQKRKECEEKSERTSWSEL